MLFYDSIHLYLQCVEVIIIYIRKWKLDFDA